MLKMLFCLFHTFIIYYYLLWNGIIIWIDYCPTQEELLSLKTEQDKTECDEKKTLALLLEKDQHLRCLEQKLQDASSTISSLEADLTIEREKCLDLGETQDRLQERIQKLMSLNEQMEILLEAKQKELAQQLISSSSMEKSLDLLQQKLEQQQTCASMAEVEKNHLQTRISNLLLSAEKEKKAWEERIQEKDALIAGLQSTIAELQKYIAGEETEMKEKMQLQNEQLSIKFKDEKCRLQDKLDQVKKELEMLQQASSEKEQSMESRFSALEEKANLEAEKATHWQTKLEESTKKVDQLTKQMKEIAEEKKNAENSLADSEEYWRLQLKNLQEEFDNALAVKGT